MSGLCPIRSCSIREDRINIGVYIHTHLGRAESTYPNLFPIPLANTMTKKKLKGKRTILLYSLQFIAVRIQSRNLRQGPGGRMQKAWKNMKECCLLAFLLPLVFSAYVLVPQSHVHSGQGPHHKSLKSTKCPHRLAHKTNLMNSFLNRRFLFPNDSSLVKLTKSWLAQWPGRLKCQAERGIS